MNAIIDARDQFGAATRRKRGSGTTVSSPQQLVTSSAEEPAASTSAFRPIRSDSLERSTHHESSAGEQQQWSRSKRKWTSFVLVIIAGIAFVFTVHTSIAVAKKQQQQQRFSRTFAVAPASASAAAETQKKNKQQQGTLRKVDVVTGKTAERITQKKRGGHEVRHDTTRSSSSSDCSCLSPSPQCCDRKILRAHKMGVVLIRDLLLKPFRKNGITSAIINPKELPVLTNTKNRTTTVSDYRHVVVTRPWYDSIVSGYLYHKSGRECWLDQDGNPRLKNKTFEWEGKLTKPVPMPPSKNRTLCSYLAEETEEDGMRVFVDLSVSDFYAGIVPHRALVQQEEDADNPRTLFICFEELSNKSTQQATFKKIMDWLYPGGHAFSLPPQPQQNYGGGHSTSRDPNLRQRLHDMVAKYDRELFNGIGASATEMFGCK